MRLLTELVFKRTSELPKLPVESAFLPQACNQAAKIALNDFSKAQRKPLVR